MPTYKYRFLGTGITNSQGIANLSKDPNNQTINGYTGVGAGKIDIVACDMSDPTTSGAMISEAKEIIDCINYDQGTTNTHNDAMWSSTSNMTRGTSTTGTQIAKQGTSYSVSTPISNNNCIDIEIKMNPSSTTSHIMNIRDSDNNNLYSITKGNSGLTNNEWNHYIITIIDGTVTVYNETTETTLTGTITGTPGLFALRILTEDDTYFRQCKIYPI